MKKRNLFITLGLALGLGVGVFAGLSAKKEVKVAKADNYNVTISTNLDSSASTMRYWFINNQSGFWDTGNEKVKAKFGIHVYGGLTDAYYLMQGIFNEDGENGQCFFYVDIPSDTTTFQLIRFSSTAVVGSDQIVWGDTSGFAVNSYKPYALHWCSGADYPYIGTLSNSPANNPNPSAHVLAKVLEGYNVCLSSDLNGYGAASYLWTNWVHTHNGNSTWGNWETLSINDYEEGTYTEHGDSYAGSTKTASFTVKAKWEGLANAASINPETGAPLGKTINLNEATNDNASFTTAVIITIAALSVFAVGGFIFAKTKER